MTLFTHPANIQCSSSNRVLAVYRHRVVAWVVWTCDFSSERSNKLITLKSRRWKGGRWEVYSGGWEISWDGWESRWVGGEICRDGRHVGREGRNISREGWKGRRKTCSRERVEVRGAWDVLIGVGVIIVRFSKRYQSWVQFGEILLGDVTTFWTFSSLRRRGSSIQESKNEINVV